MRKIALLSLGAASIIALSGCSFIENLLDREKEYSYNDYKALIADRKPTFTATKCNASIDTDGTKTTREYNYDSDSGAWVAHYEEDGYNMTDNEVLDLVSEVKGFELSAAFLNKKVADIFKFYATSKAYRVTFSYENTSDTVPFRAEGEYKYGSDGLQTYSREKLINLDAVTSTETIVEYTYSA